MVLFFGIIDILQEYNFSKKFEHQIKALQHDANAISAVSPPVYSQRFQAFMKQVFM